MKGQLWQECRRCDTEPVCAECEMCARHCCCDSGPDVTAPVPNTDPYGGQE